jgi:hypothetical protein
MSRRVLSLLIVACSTITFTACESPGVAQASNSSLIALVKIGG